MKDKSLAWARAHRTLAATLGAILALAAIVAGLTIKDVLSKPARLREGQEVVLLDCEGAYHLSPVPDPVCVLAENPREALFVVEYEKGTVLADEGSVWAPDRGVKVRLRGPDVLGKGYRDGEKYHTKLTGDRLVVKVGRSYVVPIEEFEARLKARKP